MRIVGPRPTASTPSARPRAAVGGVRFSASAEAPRAAAHVSGTAALSSVDALIALQGAEDALSAPRRAAARAERVLDELDALKLAVLDGRSGVGALQRLRVASAASRDATDDPRLEALLDEVDVRAAVELAKREAPSAPRSGERA